MNISNNQHNEAMAKFLVSRYERVVCSNFVDNESSQYESTLEQIETHDSDFLG